MLLADINTRDHGQTLIYSQNPASNQDEIRNRITEKVLESLKSVNIRNENAVIKVAQWFSQSDFVAHFNFKLLPAILHQDQHTGRQHNVIFSFALPDKYQDHFVLLRGLFQFGEKPGMHIVSDRSTGTFSVEIFSNESAGAIKYFDAVFKLLSWEINFKRKLKAVIKFEHAARVQQHQLYQHLGVAV
jgi:hypothetical protein